MKNGKNLSAAFLVLVLLLGPGCGASKNPVVPLDQFQKESPAKVTEFILGAGDKIDITVYRNDDLKRTVQIDLSGKVSFPLVGDLQAGGLGIFEFRDKIRDGLSKYIINPQVTMSVSSSQSQKIIVLGEVKNPGFFQAETAITALEAISRAGGYTLDGKLESVLVIRGGLQKPQLTSLNLKRALMEGDLTQNVMLQRGDIVYVPRTFISDVDRFFAHMTTILQPLVLLETGIFLEQQIERGSRGISISP